MYRVVFFLLLASVAIGQPSYLAKEILIDSDNDGTIDATLDADTGTVGDLIDTSTPADSSFLVGDGSTYVNEDAATALTSIGGQPLDAGLTSISGLTTAADRGIYTTASDTYAVFTLTSYGRTLIDDTDQATARTTLGLGDLATENASGITANLLPATTETIGDSGNRWIQIWGTAGDFSAAVAVGGELSVGLSGADVDSLTMTNTNGATGDDTNVVWEFENSDAATYEAGSIGLEQTDNTVSAMDVAWYLRGYNNGASETALTVSATGTASEWDVDLNGNLNATGDVTVDDVVITTPAAGRMTLSGSGFPNFEIRRSDSATAGGFRFGGSTSVNSIWRTSSGESAFGTHDLVGWMLLSSSELRVGSGFTLGFSSASNPNAGSADTTLSRAAAGVLQVDQTIAYAPGSVAITAASDTLPITNAVLEMTADSSYSFSSTPVLANGTPGQVITIICADDTDTLTIPNDATGTGSGVRLSGAVDYPMSEGDTLTVVYSSTVGDWLETARSDN